MRHTITASITLLSLAIGGCGSGSSSNTSKQTSLYTGTGSELQGTFVYRVVRSTGAYTELRYAPVGLTGILDLRRTSTMAGGSTMTLTRSDMGQGTYGDVILSPDAHTHSYSGYATYTLNAGLFFGATAHEFWTLTFVNGRPHMRSDFSIPASDPMGAPLATGSIELDMQVPYTFDDTNESYFFGRQQAYSADKRYAGQTGVLELGGVASTGHFGNVGTYGRYFLDGSAFPIDSILIEALWHDGHSLSGGGFGSGLVTGATDTFGTIRIDLDARGKPTSSSGTWRDYPNNTLASIATVNYAGEKQLQSTVEPQTWDLKIVDVTEGGMLAARFSGGVASGTILNDAMTYDGRSLHFASWANGNGQTFFVPPPERGHVVAHAWDGRIYDFLTLTPIYDMDLATNTYEMYDIDFHYGDGTGANTVVITLHIYDAMSDDLLTTEIMHCEAGAFP